MDKRIVRNTTWRKRIVTGILCLVVFMTMLLPATAYASEAEPRTIRVGYFAFPGITKSTRTRMEPMAVGTDSIFFSFFENTQI